MRLPPLIPAGPARIELYRDGALVGDCDLSACPECRQAVLEHVHIDSAHQRRGLATHLITTALADYPDYRWSTTTLTDTVAAQAFWAAMDWPGPLGVAGYCGHMRSAEELTP